MRADCMDTEVAYFHGGTSAKDNLECLLKKPASVEESEPFKTECPSLHIHYCSSGYVKKPRPCHDSRYVMLYVSFVIVIIIVGLVAVINRNPNFGLADSALYNSSSGLCYISAGYGPVSLGDGYLKHKSTFYVGKVIMSGMRQLTITGFPTSLRFHVQRELQHTDSATSLVTILVWILSVAVLLSVLLTFTLLCLLKAFPKQTVHTCLLLSVLIPLGLNLIWFFTCMATGDCKEEVSLLGRTSLFVFVLVICAVLIWTTCSNWHRMELTVGLLQAAARALSSNWGLLLVLPSLMCTLLIYIVPFGVFMVYAYMNGGIVNMPGSYCDLDWATDCCRWKNGSWTTAYYVLTCAAILWSVLIIVDAQIYITSGTIAQWYFAKTEFHHMGSLMHAVRSAFGPSFGTLCLSGSGLSLIRMIVRATLAGTEDERGQGCFFVVLRHQFADYTRLALEFFSKFTINFAAVTGESYCVSARSSYGLLKFNFLSPVLTEVISTRLLSGMAFVFSFIYAVMVFFYLRATTDLEGAAYYITLLAWFVLFIILLYFCDVLNSVIDALHVCYAIDKDLRVVSKLAVHEAYRMLPASSHDLSTVAIHHQHVQAYQSNVITK